MPWHRGSEFAHAGHHQLLNRDERGIWTARIETAHRNGRITAKALLVGLWLLRHQGRQGHCYPTRATIARLAGCCEKTVHNALEQLRTCGLLDWTRRIVRTAAGARQTSNAYRLIVAGLERLARRPKPDRRPRPTPTEKPAPRSDVEAARVLAATATRSLAEIARARLAAWQERRNGR